MRYVCLWSFWLFIGSLSAQQVVPNDSTSVDTVRELSLSHFIQTVIVEHPIAKQARLKTDFGETAIMLANGEFDPRLTADAKSKESEKFRYYRDVISSLTIPTPIGVDIVGGYRNTEGQLLNPQETTGADGQWFAGLEVNALQGVVIDARRAQLKQAQFVQDLNQNETQILLNELLYEAISTYIQWQQYYHILQVYNEGLELSQSYFENTKGSFLLGEKNAIDTLEAYIGVQDQRIKIYKAEQDLVAYRLKLQNFLWIDDVPQVLKSESLPQPIEQHLYPINTSIDIDSTLAIHPLISQKENKKQIEKVNLALKSDKLKPKLKLKYTPFLEAQPDLTPVFNDQNFTWGVSFSMPLWLRTERAQIKRSEIKIQDVEYDIKNKQNELKNKALTALQGVERYAQMASLNKQNVSGYKRLLEAEQLRFSFGESSVFLVTKRQEKYIKTSAEYIKSRAYEELARLEFLYQLNLIAQ